MIIKKIDINNFLCYYGTDNSFEFADGLNVILGDNGEGKTKFFEAIVWLFEGDKNYESKISAKALKEAKEGENFEVSVTMQVEQFNELKIVKRSFDVTKQEGENRISVTNPKIIGIVESKNGEREKKDGEDLLEIIFPTGIRRYSLFKGESELNIFDNRDALNNLVNSFSSAKYFEKYVEIGMYLKKKAEAAVDKETRNNSNKQKEIEKLKSDITACQATYTHLKEVNETDKDEIEKLKYE